MSWWLAMSEEKYTCSKCELNYRNCNCKDKEHRLNLSLHPGISNDKILLKVSKKLDGVDRYEFMKSHPTDTWCNSCNAPRYNLVCTVCGSLLNPNFHYQMGVSKWSLKNELVASNE